MITVRRIRGLLIAVCVVGTWIDVGSTWWLQQHGGIEVNPLMVRLHDAVGVNGMVVVLLVLKLAVCSLLADASGWVHDYATDVTPLVLRDLVVAADMTAVAGLVLAAAAMTFPVVHNLVTWTRLT